jgi:four helix bundle protein
MEKLKSYRDLRVWQLALDFVVEIYAITDKLPKSEKYGLISQLQRSASSIPANIAEVYGRMHRGDYLRFLSIARGSLVETETHLIIAVRTGRLSKEEVKPLWERSQKVGQHLRKLIIALRKAKEVENA